LARFPPTAIRLQLDKIRMKIVAAVKQDFASEQRVVLHSAEVPETVLRV
jgi:hypothetical protein